ncbi:MAG TPA: PHP domain-containing protein [Acidimicrobiales bacterium]|nr:PHP domain-containing protein [Acidimicrobiales bacterium]
MLDYHLHLWPHGTIGTAPTLEQLASYCEQAATHGVSEIALTEHLFRFVQADGVLGGFWTDDPDPRLQEAMAAYWQEHAHVDMDAYVDAVVAAKAAGLPVVLGLEVDYYPDRMDKVRRLVEGYPFDVLLGSVHWLGAWGFDDYEHPVVAAEWDNRAVEAVWADYTRALEELAACDVVDVLAHPDLCKVTGRRPGTPEEFYDRMAEAAAGSGMAAEVSSAGWRKPVGEEYPAPPLLARFKARGVPVTTASDAHEVATVAHRADDLRAVLAAAGYDELQAYRQRTPHPVAL